MVVLSSSISAKVSKMSCHECKGYKWQCPTTQSPTQQHNEPQRKILGGPSDAPPPPPGERQGVGNDKGGKGYVRVGQSSLCNGVPQVPMQHASHAVFPKTVKVGGSSPAVMWEI